MENSVQELITPSLINLVLELDKLQATRQAIAEIVAPALKAVDKDIKGFKARITESLNGISANDAVKVATHFCAIVLKKGESTPKQIQRRRDTFLAVLTAKYPLYDFERDSIGCFECVLVGDEHTRKANSMLAVVAELQELGFTTQAIDRDELVDTIKAQKQEYQGNSKVSPVDKTQARHYLSLCESSLSTGLNLVQSGNKAKEGKVKQA